MFTSTLNKSVVMIFNAVFISTGLLISMSSYAQNTTPGSTTAPTASPTTTPTVTPGNTTTPTVSPTTTPTVTPATTTAPATTTKPAKPVTSTPKSKTIVSIASGNRNFTTLVKALKAADLVDTLAGKGPYTVFAPTNAAFAKLPKTTLANLLKPENKEQLKKVLTYHVVSGAVTSKAIKSGAVATVEGSSVNVKVSGRNIFVNKAKVILPDVKASNGVIHAIDTVLLPPSK